MSIPVASEHLIQTILERARKSLSPYRFCHVLGVTHTIMILADIHGLPLMEAAQAGLLHDISKEVKPETIRRDLERFGEPLDEEDREFPKTWHAIHAAAVARHELGIDSPEIFEAVRFHTTAEAGIGPLAIALIIADLTEPGRKPSVVGHILDIARRDLNEGFRLSLLAKIEHVHQKHGRIHPRGLRAARAYLPELMPATEPSLDAL